MSDREYPQWALDEAREFLRERNQEKPMEYEVERAAEFGLRALAQEEDSKSRVGEWITPEETERLISEEYDRLKPGYPNGVPAEKVSEACMARMQREYPQLSL